MSYLVFGTVASGNQGAGLERRSREAAQISRWARSLVEGGPSNHVRLWLTEGYDDAFTDIACPASELESVLAKRVRAGLDVPSPRVTVVAGADG